MTDRELLELAAKAAGWMPNNNWTWSPRSGADGAFRYRCGGDWVEWNPLTDDGDALRLAVGLDLSSLMVWTHPGVGKRREFWSPNSGQDGGKSATTEAEYEANPFAATRRAIVRAAAEIGRNMK